MMMIMMMMMMQSFADRRIKNTGKKIMNLNNLFSLARVQRSLMTLGGGMTKQDKSEIDDDTQPCQATVPREMNTVNSVLVDERSHRRLQQEHDILGVQEQTPCKQQHPLLVTMPETNEKVPSETMDHGIAHATYSNDIKYDPWERVDEDFDGIHFDFNIIATSTEENAVSSHVLSPPLMHHLQDSLPPCKQGESFWLKYSLVRDGASLTTFLNKASSSKYTIMAVETVEGEVFGVFAAEPWHLDHTFYGTSESFVWKMRHYRGEIIEAMAEQATRENDINKIDVYRYSHENNMVQLCQSHPYRLATGGGDCSFSREIPGGEIVDPHQWGFAISFDDDCLLEGTTSPCLTFCSPSLSRIHNDGSKFEVLNLELWALTPCLNVNDAEMLECRRTFIQAQTTYRM